MLGSAGSALFNTSLNQVNRIDPGARGPEAFTISPSTLYQTPLIIFIWKFPHEPWLNNWLNNWLLDCLISIKAKILFGQNISQFVHAFLHLFIFTLIAMSLHFPLPCSPILQFIFDEGSIITLTEGRPWSVFKGCFALIICCRQAGLVTSYPE